MADRIKIEINGDASGLIKALKSAETRLDTFNKRVTASSRNLTAFIKQMQATTASMGSLNASINAIVQANARLIASVNAASTGMQRFNNSTTNSARAARNAANAKGMMNLRVKDLIMGMTSLNTVLYTSAFLFGGITKSVIDANSRYERMTVLLRNISGESLLAKKNMYADRAGGYIWDLANNAPFKVDALTDSFVKLKAAGIDPMNGSLQSLVDATAFFGGDTEKLKRAGVALSQMLSKGIVQSEELKGQLAEAVPNAVNDMAKALGKTRMELAKEMEKGNIASADAVPKLLALWKKQYGGAANAMMDTWDGLMARMSNAWQQMIVRVTQSQGENSLFENLKKQFKDLTDFLASKQGDAFMADISAGLGQLTAMVASGIKFVYKYREEILALAKAFAYLWVGGRVIAAFGAVGSAISGGIGAIIRMRAALIALTQVQSGVALVQMAFGRNVRIAAQSLGLFNAQAQISRAALVGLLGTFGLITGALVAWVAIQYKANQATERARQPNERYARVLNSVEIAGKATTAVINNLATATGAAADKAMEAARKHAVALRAMSEAARASVAILRKSEQERKKVYEETRSQTSFNVGEAAGNALKTAKFLPGGGLAGEIIGPMLQWGTGANPFIRGQREFNRWKQREAELKRGEEIQAKVQAQEEALWNGIFGSLNGDNKPTTPEATGGGKPEKDKLGSLDGSRQQLVNLLMRVKEEQAKLKGPEGIEAFAENRDDIEEKVRAQVQAITSQKALNAAILDQKSVLAQVKLEVKEFNAAEKIRLANVERMTALEADQKDQQLKTAEAIGEIDEAYSSIDNQVQRYVNNLREKNKELLATNDLALRLKANTTINGMANDYRQELVAKQAGGTKQALQEIQDSLLTENELREVNYQREVERINNLIAENDKIMGPQAAANAKIFYDYLDALRQKNAMNNPFAQWARGAATLKDNVGNALAGSLDGFINSLAQGKAAMGEFAVSLVKDLGLIIIKALIAKAVLTALGLGGNANLSANASSVTGGVDTFNLNGGLAPMTSFDIRGTPIYAGNHEGGIAGREATFFRSMDPGMFSFAKRYHGGGVPGLGPNEVPIIAEKGEGIFTKEQMRAMGSGSAQVPPTINIINQTGTDISQENAEPRFDGEQMIVDVLLKKASRPGPVRDLMRNNK